MQMRMISCYLALFLFLTPIYASDDLHVLTREEKNFWFGQNHMSPMETAGAHGVKGVQVGTGLSQAAQSTSGVVPKFWFTKGLFYPFDLGFSMGSSSQKRIDQLGGYLQYTFYEAFSQPAFALRLKYSELDGQSDSANLKTYGGEVVGSWGVGPLSIYGTLGYDLNRWDQEQEGVIENSLGLEMQLVPHFVRLSGEGLFRSTDLQFVQAKFSVGL